MVLRQVSPNDLALLKLERPLAYNQFTRPIKLPYQNEAIRNTQSWLSGWGSIDPNGANFPATLKKANVPIIDNNSCKLNLESITKQYAPVVDSTLCTGPTTPQISACNVR